MAPAKADLLHMIPLTSSSSIPVDSSPVMLEPHPVRHSPAIKLLGDGVDYHLYFSKHGDLAASKMDQFAACLKTIARVKNLSPLSM